MNFLNSASANITNEERKILEMIDPQEVTELLQTLIQARSDFPPGDTREITRIISEKFASAEVTHEIAAKKEHQPNLLAFLGDVNAQPCLVYHAHLDTVASGHPASWTLDPFSGEIRNGMIYGRGAGDDKGSAAAQIMALITLKRAKVRMAGCLQAALVSAEESGANEGTVWLRDTGRLKPDYLVVGEQTMNRVAIAERVACGIDLTVFGKAAHGAMPWAGDNAVLKMAGVLTWLNKKLFPVYNARVHPYLPRPTLNFGKISGGISWSIVPESCKVEMDRRLLPGETREMAMDEIRTLLDEYAETVEPLKYELFTQGEVAPNIETSPEDPFAVLAEKTLRDLTGETLGFGGYAQTSDGRWFAGKGIPIIIFGPSDPAVAHGPDERISIDQLVEATRFLTLLALRQLKK